MSERASRIIMLFVDGVGLGPPDATINPLLAGPYPGIERLTGGPSLSAAAPEFSRPGHLFRGIDANLGVDGLPQSGTGQATIFTGVNCAQLAGRHFGPFPHTTSRAVIRESNLFIETERLTGSPAIFANAYPDRFFRYIERTGRWTVTTLCCSAAGVRLRTVVDLVAGRALSADITGESWPEQHATHKILTPQEAGRRLAQIAVEGRLTVFEYFQTDKAGHSRDADQAVAALKRLDGFIEGVLASLDEEQTLVVTSDHGNVEDLSVKTHTRNPVPLMVYGPAAGQFDEVDGLAGIRASIMDAIGTNESSRF